MELLMAQGSGFSAWLIRVFTKSPYSHSAIRFEGCESNKILHSTIGGVQISTFDYINEHYTGILRFKVKCPEARDAALVIESKYLGFEYDYMSFIGIGLAIIFKLKKNPIAQKKTLMCTEVPANWLNHIQSMNPAYNIPYLDPELLTPVSLKEFCESRPDLFEAL